MAVAFAGRGGAAARDRSLANRYPWHRRRARTRGGQWLGGPAERAGARAVELLLFFLIKKWRLSLPGKTFSGSLQVRAVVQVLAVVPAVEGRCRTSYPAPARRSRERRGAIWRFFSALRRAVT
jgi:hypothetical protein